MASTSTIPLELRLSSAALSSTQGPPCKLAFAYNPLLKASTSLSSMDLRTRSYFLQPAFRTSRCRLSVACTEQGSGKSPAPSETDNLMASMIPSDEKVPLDPNESTSLQAMTAVLVGFCLGYFTTRVWRAGWFLVKSSLRAKRLCTKLDRYFPAARSTMTPVIFNNIAKENGISREAVLTTYIHHVLIVRTFDDELVADLTHLRRVSNLDDKAVVDILCEIGRRIVRLGGPLCVDTTGLTEWELEDQRLTRLAFTKTLSLAETWFPDNLDSSKVVEAFELTEEDAVKLRKDPLIFGDS